MTTMKETNIEDKAIIEWQKLTIANRDERIDLLERAIGEFLRSEANEDTADDWIDSLDAKQKLRDIMEQAK